MTTKDFIPEIQTDLACDEKAISVVLYKVLLDVWDAQDTSIFLMHHVGLSWEEACERRKNSENSS